MKYYIEIVGDRSVGIDPEYHTVDLRWDIGPENYDIEFYNDFESKFIELLKESFDNGTMVKVLTEYDIGDDNEY